MKEGTKGLGTPVWKLWIWIPACTILALFIYLCGALATRVMWEKGKITQGSWTYSTVVFIYRPLDQVSASSPDFRYAFKACVDFLVPENKDGK
ncbi:MAG: hypothetical protein JWM68_640 [Verrucomicrobiales bacterium]|nr:hypothetical protein [Verrucomicrobiales bacterium]